MADFTFFNCTVCGFLGTKNFRDTYCPACKACARNINQINFYFDEADHLEIGNAPHTDELDG